jgi:hypothetical protein
MSALSPRPGRGPIRGLSGRCAMSFGPTAWLGAWLSICLGMCLGTWLSACSTAPAPAP